MNKSDVLKDKKFLIPMVVIVLITILLPVGIFKLTYLFQDSEFEEFRPELEAINMEDIIEKNNLKSVDSIYRDVNWAGSGIVYKQYHLKEDIDDTILLKGYKDSSNDRKIIVRESTLDSNGMKDKVSLIENGIKDDSYKKLYSNFFKSESVFVYKEILSHRKEDNKDVPVSNYYMSYNKENDTLNIVYINF